MGGRVKGGGGREGRKGRGKEREREEDSKGRGVTALLVAAVGYVE